MTPRPIPDSVRALLPLCGASNDHEALGACRGIGRKLQAAGLDWHALAAAIPAGEGHNNVTTLPTGGPTWNAEAWGQVRPGRRKRYVFTPTQTAEHRRLALWVRNADAGRLSPRERQFISDITHRRRELSLAQADWLNVICDRLAMEAHA